jgi:hypothetical protein
MNSKTQLKQLKWLLDFLSMDLEEMSDIELQKTVLDLSSLAYGFVDRPEQKVKRALKLGGQGISGNHVELIKIQKELIERTKPVFDSIEKTLTYKDGNVLPTFSDKISFKFNLSISLEYDVETNQKGEPEELNGFYFSTVEHLLQTNLQKILITFYSNLRFVPASSFIKCIECGNWSVKLTSKTKEFCSVKCASRYSVREKRKRARKREEVEVKHS